MEGVGRRVRMFGWGAGVPLAVALLVVGAAAVSAPSAVTSTVTLNPEADAYVDAGNPTKNYGNSSTLRVDNSPIQRSYLRFNLGSVTGTVTQATLRVYANTALSAGYDVYSVADTTWVEATGSSKITYSNAPPLASSKTGSSGSVGANTWTSVDVTPLASPGHKVSLALTTTSSTALSMSSREGANTPQLVVTTTSSSDTQAPSVPSGVTATGVSPTEIDVGWAASTDDTGVTGYSIYKDGSGTPLATVSGTTLSYPDTSVSAGSTHSYTVDAFDAAGNRSAQSSPPASATTPNAPGCTTTTQPGYTVTVCLTSPTAPGSVTGSLPVSATVTTTGSPPSAPKIRFCVDDSGCTNAASGYALSDFQASSGVYSASLPTARWVDGVHAITARGWISNSTTDWLSNPSPVVSMTFANGVSQPPQNGNSFVPTSGTPGSPFVVAAVGDGGSGETPSNSDVANLIAGWNPSLFLYLGDVYEKGSPSEFSNYYDPNNFFGQFRSITDPTVGNHEYSFDSGASGYFNYWDTTRHFYSFDAGGWHFISLDSTSQYNQTAPGTGQYQWLQQDLAADSAQCTLVYYHHPLWNTGPEGQTTRMSAIWSLLVSHGGVLVLNGHDHDYQRYGPLDWNGQPNANGVVEIIAGTGGHGHQSQVTTDPNRVAADFTHFGALKLTLNPTSATFAFIPTGGATQDSGTIPCNPPPVQPPPAPSLTVTPSDGNDYANGTNLYYKPSAGSGSFTVGATATGATSATFPDVFAPGDGGSATGTQPFTHTYTWTSGASTSGSFGVTVSNSGGTSPASQFTVTPDGAAPVTSMLCNFGACGGTYSSTVSVSLVASDGGSGVASTYYTTDGSDPTTSPTRSVYSAPILLTGTTTVRFFSTDHVGNVEAPQSQTITITPPAGITLTQSARNGGTTGTVTATLQSASLPGDTLVAVVALAAGSSASVLSVTDSASGSWVKGPVGFLTGINSRVEIWYRLGAPTVTSVTVTLSAAKSAAVSVSEWSGIATASQPDKSAGGSGASATTIATATGFNTLNASDLLIAAANYPATATASLTSAGWTVLDSFSQGTGVHGLAAYQITSATGSYQATWTLSASSGGHGTAILALKAA